MTDRDHAPHLWQDSCAAKPGRGDLIAAFRAPQPELAWRCAQVWAHHGLHRDNPMPRQSPAAMRDCDLVRAPQPHGAAITRRIRRPLDGGALPVCGRGAGAGKVDHRLVRPQNWAGVLPHGAATVTLFCDIRSLA